MGMGMTWDFPFYTYSSRKSRGFEWEFQHKRYFHGYENGNKNLKFIKISTVSRNSGNGFLLKSQSY